MSGVMWGLLIFFGVIWTFTAFAMVFAETQEDDEDYI
tara:strand:+ start:163 stop:273 length:111 start_codon:yes stop_codon:yes gene_type:complete